MFEDFSNNLYENSTIKISHWIHRFFSLFYPFPLNTNSFMIRINKERTS
jgi:hypothetical protein